MANLVIVECPECEGEGKELDTFAIPKLPHERTSIFVGERRSRLGYEITRDECQFCRGSGAVRILLRKK